VRRTTWSPCAIALFLLSFVVWDMPARADTSSAETADDTYSRAQSKDDALELRDALTLYERSESLDARGAHAAAARARATFLRAHSEGDFAPLTALETLRRDPKRADDPDALADLGAKSHAFPPGLVRVETWLFLAHAFARKQNDDGAIEFSRRAANDPAADEIARTDAASLLAETCMHRGDTACALDAARDKGVSAEVRARIERVVRRGRLVFAAAFVLLAIVAASILAIARSRAKLQRPTFGFLVRPVLAAVVISAGGMIASSYDGATPLPFFLLAFAVLVLSVLGALVSSVARSSAILRGISFAVAVVAAGFLSLYASGPDYLTDFGL